MKSLHLICRILCTMAVVMGVVLLFKTVVFAEDSNSFPENTIFEQKIEGNGEVEVLSIANPTQAKVIVNTNVYGAPNPSTGEILNTISSNTTVWVVEKVWCSYNSRYYYYAGYTYNNKSLRGYVCEDNVYINSTRLLPENVDNETKPSGKNYTSLSATVYSGPRSEHAAIGSVGVETVTVIRREEMSYFIEYTVTSTGKLKRGFIHIDYIQKPTTGQLPEIVTGNYHIKNKKTGKYLTVRNGNYAVYEYIDQSTFDADMSQRWRISYNSTLKCYTIRPVNSGLYLSIYNGYTSGNRYNATLQGTDGETLDRCFYIKKVSADSYKLLTGSSSGVECLDLSYRNSNDNIYTKMWYDETSDYQEWIFESLETAYSTETQSPLLMNMVDNGNGYTYVNFRVDTRLDLCGWNQNTNYKVSGVSCWANSENVYGDNNTIIPVDYTVYSCDLKINNVLQSGFYEWEETSRIIGDNWHWSDRYYPTHNLVLNKSQENNFAITVGVVLQNGFYPVSQTNLNYIVE